MSLRQISVFMEDRTGRIAEVTKILSQGDVNIRGISLADTHDFGIVRLIVDKVDEALELLKREKFTVRDTEVIAVDLPDEKGKLAEFLKVLSDGKVDIGYFYGFAVKSGETAILIFRFKDVDQAVDIIKKNGYRILNGEELYSL